MTQVERYILCCRCKPNNSLDAFKCYNNNYTLQDYPARNKHFHSTWYVWFKKVCGLYVICFRVCLCVCIGLCWFIFVWCTSMSLQQLTMLPQYHRCPATPLRRRQEWGRQLCLHPLYLELQLNPRLTTQCPHILLAAMLPQTLVSIKTKDVTCIDCLYLHFSQLID